MLSLQPWLRASIRCDGERSRSPAVVTVPMQGVPLKHATSPSKLLGRIAVAGMALAVAALGALAIWAAIVTQNGAHGLTHAGVQTSGHLRAIQALSIIDTSSDELEQGIIPSELAKLRRGQRVLDDALDRMQNGEVREARQIATRAKPIMRVMKPRIERFLARPPGYNSDGTAGREAAMEASLGELQLLLNDLDSDPSGLLTEKLAAVTASERTVRRTAFVLIPLGLGSVWCARGCWARTAAARRRRCAAPSWRRRRRRAPIS